jgi:hypothetical protein
MIRGDFLLPRAPPLLEVMVNRKNRATHQPAPDQPNRRARDFSLADHAQQLGQAGLPNRSARPSITSPPKTLNLVSQKHGAEMAI